MQLILHTLFVSALGKYAGRKEKIGDNDQWLIIVVPTPLFTARSTSWWTSHCLSLLILLYLCLGEKYIFLNVGGVLLQNECLSVNIRRTAPEKA
jgi:hypothetical protein